MKKTAYCIFVTLFAIGQINAQTKVITTGNNLVSATDPYAADIVVGSDANSGIRHDASIMWWSNSSASRISNTSDIFYFSVWASPSTPNIALGAASGAASYFRGNVLIGKTSQTNTNYRLDVGGNIRANQIVVNTTGADFVFDSAYHMLPLPALKNYILTNHHLPDIAPAAEMLSAGIDLGDNQTKLLQKVEELTLYLIEKDEQEKEQAKINHLLEERLLAQDKQIKAMARKMELLTKKKK
jgi:hypothetical protein